MIVGIALSSGSESSSSPVSASYSTTPPSDIPFKCPPGENPGVCGAVNPLERVPGRPNSLVPRRARLYLAWAEGCGCRQLDSLNTSPVPREDSQAEIPGPCPRSTRSRPGASASLRAAFERETARKPAAHEAARILSDKNMPHRSSLVNTSYESKAYVQRTRRMSRELARNAVGVPAGDENPVERMAAVGHATVFIVIHCLASVHALRRPTGRSSKLR